MGWKKSPSIFCMATETVADLGNVALRCNTSALSHMLDDMAEAIVREEPPTLPPSLSGLTRDPYYRRATTKATSYIDVFIDNFLVISQGPSQRRSQVLRTLLNSLEKVFHPCDSVYQYNQKEVLSLNNNIAGDCIWTT